MMFLQLAYAPFGGLRRLVSNGKRRLLACGDFEPLGGVGHPRSPTCHRESVGAKLLAVQAQHL